MHPNNPGQRLAGSGPLSLRLCPSTILAAACHKTTWATPPTCPMWEDYLVCHPLQTHHPKRKACPHDSILPCKISKATLDCHRLLTTPRLQLQRVWANLEGLQGVESALWLSGFPTFTKFRQLKKDLKVWRVTCKSIQYILCKSSLYILYNFRTSSCSSGSLQRLQSGKSVQPPAAPNAVISLPTPISIHSLDLILSSVHLLLYICFWKNAWISVSIIVITAYVSLAFRAKKHNTP